MCRIAKREKYKREAMLTWLDPEGVKAITYFSYKSNLCVLSCSTPNQKEKETERERPGHPKPNSLPKSHLIKPYWSMMIAHIIFDLMGNDLQSQSMTYLWSGIRMKHLSVWNFIHLEQFSLFSWTQCFF